MNKYLGIIKLETEKMIGIGIKLLAKTSNDKSILESWFNLYPNSKRIILNNSEELDNFFKTFIDYTPVTNEEKEIAKIAQEKYQKIIKKR